jgi:hypothetical protein
MKSINSYMVVLIILILIPTVIGLTDHSPPLGNGELEIRVENCPPSTVITYDLHNVGGAAWDGDYNLTTAYNDYSIDTTKQNYGWDWVDGLDCCDFSFCYAKSLVSG